MGSTASKPSKTPKDSQPNPNVGKTNGRINFVLMGATGNLAEKYLWQGLFNIEKDGIKTKDDIFIYPAATKDAEVSVPILEKLLMNNITSEDQAKKQDFIATHVAPYSQLRSPEDYETLAKKIEVDLAKANMVESGRIVYLSVPPKFFASISDNINKFLRPKVTKTGQQPFLRVIVEKPFGEDLKSAVELADGMYKTLKNEEIYLVDHYMGKAGLEVIRDFRLSNPKFDAEELSGSNVKRVEVGMFGPETLEHRTAFYEGVGVIRDVMQNHLMMMLSFLGGDLDLMVSSEQAARLDFFKKIKAATSDDVKFLGQYRSYPLHVLADRIKNKQTDEAVITNVQTNTPSYARIDIEVVNKNSKLGHAEISLVSGKAVKRKTAYVEVELLDGSRLMFNLQGNNRFVDGLGVYVNASKPVNIPPQWVRSEKESNEKRLVMRPNFVAKDAYEVLLRASFENKVDSFVNLDEVLESWRILDATLVEDANKLVKYDVGAESPERVIRKRPHDEL